MSEDIRNFDDYKNFLDHEARRQEYENAVVKTLMEHGGALPKDELTRVVVTRLFHSRSMISAHEEGELFTMALTNLRKRATISVGAHDRIILSPSIMRAQEL